MTVQPESLAFEPLPIKPRGSLEILGAALYLYRRYALVLLFWSLVANAGAVAAIFLGSWCDSGISLCFYVPELCNCLFMPFIIGATACVLFAALRGEKVGLRQCWLFFDPRYSGMALAYVSTAVYSGIALALCVTIGHVWFDVMSRAVVFILNASLMEANCLAGVTMLPAVAIVCVAALPILAWKWMAPLVACLEIDELGPDDPAMEALERAGNLVSRDWWRMSNVALLVSMAVSAVLSWNFASLFYSGAENGNLATQAMKRAKSLIFRDGWRVTRVISLVALAILAEFVLGAAWAVHLGLPKVFHQALDYNIVDHGRLFLLWSTLAVAQIISAPAIFLVAAVLYLDLRVRHEAPELAWVAHLASPRENSEAKMGEEPGR